jgi:pSer/pThr/pTyr-binding forkhead associated (FHA) protein
LRAGGEDVVIATLTVVEGDLVGDAFVLRAGQNHLGRGAECSLVLNSRWISRSHAYVICENGMMLIRATEGKEVWVNDALTVERNLKDGDRIRLGTTILSLRMVDTGSRSISSVFPVTPEGSGVVKLPSAVDKPPAPAPLAPPAPPVAVANAPIAKATPPPKKRNWRFWKKSVPSLVFIAGERSGERIELTDSRFRIGALGENDIVISGSEASRNHAELRIRDGRVHIWDLRSVNGTWVNDQRIENKELESGDVVRIGNAELRYED